MTAYDWGLETGFALYGFIRLIIYPLVRVTAPKIIMLLAGWAGQDILRHYIDHHFIRDHDET